MVHNGNTYSGKRQFYAQVMLESFNELADTTEVALLASNANTKRQVSRQQVLQLSEGLAMSALHFVFQVLTQLNSRWMKDVILLS